MRTIILLLMLFPATLVGQLTYTDPAVAGAIVTSAGLLKTEQNKTNDLLGQVRNAQSAIAIQLRAAEELQQKIYKGLSQVSAVVNDAYYVKKTYQNCESILSNASDISSFVAQHPQYAIFANNMVREFRERVLLLTAEVTATLTGGELNLMNSGQRRELLRNIEVQTSLLASTSWLMLIAMQRAKANGFWQSINPFAVYINRDKQIARDIISQIKYL